MAWTLRIAVMAFVQCSLGERDEAVKRPIHMESATKTQVHDLIAEITQLRRANAEVTMKAELLANEVRRLAASKKPALPERRESRKDDHIHEHGREADSSADGMYEVGIMVHGAPVAVRHNAGTSALEGRFRKKLMEELETLLTEDTNHTNGAAPWKEGTSDAVEMVLASEVRKKSSSKVVATREGNSKDDAGTSGVCCCGQGFCYEKAGFEHVLGSKVYCCAYVNFFCDTVFSSDFPIPVENIHQNTMYTPLVSDPCKTSSTYSRCPASVNPYACQSFSSGPGFDDVEQGELGNCYLLASLIAIAQTHPGIIKDMFVDPNCESGDIPVYRTRWYPDGVETLVAVDAQVPYDERWDRPYFTRSRKGRNSVWPVVLEKAWAKLFGSYMMSDTGGDPHEVLRAITGAPVESWDHDEVQSDDLWAKMVAADRAFFPMTACSKQVTRSGIAGNHAFAVRGVMTGSDRTVQLQQPWARHQYHGNQMQYKGLDKDKGTFFMTWDEYRRDMFTTSAAYVRDGYVISSLVSPRAGTEIGYSVSFKLTKSKPFSIQFEWTRERFFDQACEYHSQDFRLIFWQDGVKLTNDKYTATREPSSLRIEPNTASFTGIWKLAGTFGMSGGIMNSKFAVAVYAAEHVKIEGNMNINKFNATTNCNPHLARPRDLDNVEDIKAGEDSYFPPALTSIGGGLLGDTAQNIATEAEKYNTWKRFTDFYK